MEFLRNYGFHMLTSLTSIGGLYYYVLDHDKRRNKELQFIFNKKKVKTNNEIEDDKLCYMDYSDHNLKNIDLIKNMIHGVHAKISLKYKDDYSNINVVDFDIYNEDGKIKIDKPSDKLEDLQLIDSIEHSKLKEIIDNNSDIWKSIESFIKNKNIKDDDEYLIFADVIKEDDKMFFINKNQHSKSLETAMNYNNGYYWRKWLNKIGLISFGFGLSMLFRFKCSSNNSSTNNCPSASVSTSGLASLIYKK